MSAFRVIAAESRLLRPALSYYIRNGVIAPKPQLFDLHLVYCVLLRMQKQLLAP